MSLDQTSFGMAYDAESEIKAVFEERFEEYTGKAADVWTLSCTCTCICSIDCTGGTCD